MVKLHHKAFLSPHIQAVVSQTHFGHLYQYVPKIQGLFYDQAMCNLPEAASDTWMKIPEDSPGSNNYTDLLVSFDNVETTNGTGNTDSSFSGNVASTGCKTVRITFLGNAWIS